MATPDFHTDYQAARDAYWDAQRALRHAGMQEMLRLAPPEVVKIRLEVNDTPRLTVTDLFDADGNDLMDGSDDYDDLWSVLDQIAMDMEAFNWDEADSFLLSDGEEGFIIERDGDQ